MGLKVKTEFELELSGQLEVYPVMDSQSYLLHNFIKLQTLLYIQKFITPKFK